MLKAAAASSVKAVLLPAYTAGVLGREEFKALAQAAVHRALRMVPAGLGPGEAVALLGRGSHLVTAAVDAVREEGRSRVAA